MRTNAIVRIVIFAIVVVLLLGILGIGIAARYYALDLSAWYNNSNSGDYSPAELGTPVSVNGLIREISIDWVAGSIIIQPSAEAKNISFSETNVSDSSNQMIYKQSGDSLTIQFCKDSVRFLGFSSNISKDLVITVPSDWICQELEIDTASANVEGRNLTIESFDFDGASGVCTFTDCTVREMDMDTASGDIRFTGCLDKLQIDSMSANCRIAVINTTREISISTMSGDLDLALPEDCGFTLSIDSVSSDFSSEFDTVLSRGNHVRGDGSCRIDIEAMSGSVSIRKANPVPASTEQNTF